MVVMVVVLPINHTPNVTKLLDMAGNGDWAFVIKPILFLGLFQQLHEERVIEVNHGHHKSLFFFPLPNLHCQTPLRHIVSNSHFLLLLLLLFPSSAHLIYLSICNSQQTKQKPNKKNIVLRIK